MTLVQSPSLDLIRRALSKECPGLPAQLHMSPPYREQTIPRQIVNPNHGGVLILLYPCDETLCFVLMRRTDHLDHHKGQISLPGGRVEPEDKDLRETALREAREELGISLESVEVLCSLTQLYIPPSNFYIYPSVAYCAYHPDFRPDPNEVAELIEVPLMTLLDPRTRVVEEWTRPELSCTIMMPYYAVGEHKVWGATAMVLAEFGAMLQSELGSAPGIALEFMTPDQIDADRHAIMGVYRAAFAAPPYAEGVAELSRFALSLTEHAQREGFRLVVAREVTSDQIVGFAYGYASKPGQWWHDTIAAHFTPEQRADWLGDSYEFVELAVTPVMQGYGIGGRLHDALLRDLPQRTAVLSTYQGDTHAMRLYRGRGWVVLCENFVYPSDDPSSDKPFVIMGLRL
jgi:8-oxo-dGTP pyrophosphatase MutT (NUDIX family)/ribosomal protein S18 acetylase RimI-like enzyme